MVLRSGSTPDSARANHDESRKKSNHKQLTTECAEDSEKKIGFGFSFPCLSVLSVVDLLSFRTHDQL